MKKNKKILTSLIIASTFSSTLVVSTVSIENKNLIQNKANHTVNYANNTIDGIQLQKSNYLLEFNNRVVDIYTNCNPETREFPNNEPSYLIVKKRTETNGPFFDKIRDADPFVLIKNDLKTDDGAALIVEQPTPGYRKQKVDLTLFNDSGTYNENSFQYNVKQIELMKVGINGKYKYLDRDNFDITASPIFDAINPPTEGVSYRWFQTIGDQETIIDGQNTNKLTAPVPDIPDGAKLQIVCEVSYKGKTIKSPPMNITIVGKNDDSGNKPGTNDGSQNDGEANKEENNILTAWYLWVPIALVIILIAIAILVYFFIKNKKAVEKQANQIRRLSAKKLPSSGNSSVKYLGGPTGPNNNPSRRPVNQNNVPNKKPNGSMNQSTNAPSNQAPIPPRGPVPISRPGNSAQKPGMNRPSTPLPPKIEVNAPPRSLAPKKK